MAPSDEWDDPDFFKLDWDPKTENELGLISYSRSGQLFLRQAGGMEALPCTTIGFYVPLLATCREITEFFLKNPLRLDEDQSAHVSFVEERLEQYGFSKYIKITRLLEAFTAVEIVALDPSWPPEMRCGEGVLTWPNSD